MTQEDYQDRVDRRRDRLNGGADKAAAKSAAAYETSHRITEHMTGEPIKIGHHSEGRHRRDLEKSHNAMRTSINEDSKAENLRERAAAVGTGGISSDDPDATDKLQAELVDLKAERIEMKRINAVHKRGGWEAVTADKGDEWATLMNRSGDRRPHSDYTHIGASIRRLEQRVKHIAAENAIPKAKDIPCNGATIVDRPDLNRITVVFDEKPSGEVCKMMHSEGFRWSRHEIAWMRQRHNGSRHAAGRVRQYLNE